MPASRNRKKRAVARYPLPKWIITRVDQPAQFAFIINIDTSEASPAFIKNVIQAANIINQLGFINITVFEDKKDINNDPYINKVYFLDETTSEESMEPTVTCVNAIYNRVVYNMYIDYSASSNFVNHEIICQLKKFKTISLDVILHEIFHDLLLQMHGFEFNPAGLILNSEAMQLKEGSQEGGLQIYEDGTTYYGINTNHVSSLFSILYYAHGIQVNDSMVRSILSALPYLFTGKLIDYTIKMAKEHNRALIAPDDLALLASVAYDNTPLFVSTLPPTAWPAYIMLKDNPALKIVLDELCQAEHCRSHLLTKEQFHYQLSFNQSHQNINISDAFKIASFGDIPRCMPLLTPDWPSFLSLNNETCMLTISPIDSDFVDQEQQNKQMGIPPFNTNLYIEIMTRPWKRKTVQIKFTLDDGLSNQLSLNQPMSRWVPSPGKMRIDINIIANFPPSHYLEVIQAIAAINQMKLGMYLTIVSSSTEDQYNNIINITGQMTSKDNNLGCKIQINTDQQRKLICNIHDSKSVGKVKQWIQRELICLFMGFHSQEPDLALSMFSIQRLPSAHSFFYERRAAIKHELDKLSLSQSLKNNFSYLMSKYFGQGDILSPIDMDRLRQVIYLNLLDKPVRDNNPSSCVLHYKEDIDKQERNDILQRHIMGNSLSRQSARFALCLMSNKKDKCLCERLLTALCQSSQLCPPYLLSLGIVHKEVLANPQLSFSFDVIHECKVVTFHQPVICKITGNCQDDSFLIDDCILTVTSDIGLEPGKGTFLRLEVQIQTNNYDNHFLSCLFYLTIVEELTLSPPMTTFQSQPSKLLPIIDSCDAIQDSPETAQDSQKTIQSHQLIVTNPQTSVPPEQKFYANITELCGAFSLPHYTDKLRCHPISAIGSQPIIITPDCQLWLWGNVTHLPRNTVRIAISDQANGLTKECAVEYGRAQEALTFLNFCCLSWYRKTKQTSLLSEQLFKLASAFRTLETMLEKTMLHSKTVANLKHCFLRPFLRLANHLSVITATDQDQPLDHHCYQQLYTLCTLVLYYRERIHPKIRHDFNQADKSILDNIETSLDQLSNQKLNINSRSWEQAWLTLQRKYHQFQLSYAASTHAEVIDLKEAIDHFLGQKASIPTLQDIIGHHSLSEQLKHSPLMENSRAQSPVATHSCQSLLKGTYSSMRKSFGLFVDNKLGRLFSQTNADCSFFSRAYHRF